MDLLASYEDGENSGTNSPFLKKDEHKPMSPNASLQAEWESFEKMIGGGGSDDSSTDVIPVSTDQYLVGGIVAYPGMMQVKHGNQEYSGENTNSSPERKKGRSLADDVMKLLGSSNLTEELDMPPRKRSHSSDSSRSSSSDGSESRSPSVSPERGTNDKERTPDLVKDRLTEEVPDDRSSRKRTISNTSASADEKPSTDLEKQDRSPTRRKRSSSRSPNRRKRSRSSRSRNRSGSRTRKRSRDRKRSPRRSRERRHKKDRRSSRDRHKRRGKDGKRRSRSRERHHKRSHRRSRSRSPRHKHKRSRSHSRNRDRPHRSRSRSRDKSHRSRSRSRDRSHRSRSRSRDRSHRSDHSRAGPSRDEGEKHLTFKEKMRQQLLKASKYLQAGESLEGIDEVPKEKPSKLPLNDKSFFAAMAASTASGVTPQMALIQTMAAMHQKAQEMTGVAVPKYYNPAAVNPLKYAEQVQKRKLLWSKSRDTKKDEKEKEWENTAFISDQNGKVAAKFRKLMGIKHDEQEEEEGAPELTDEQKKKQEEMFCRLDKEYEFARMTTHTHRGVGLGFSSQGFSAT